MTAPRHLQLLEILKSGPMTSIEIAELTNIPRVQVTNGLCTLAQEGYLSKTKNNRGRTVYRLRADVAIPESKRQPKYEVPIKRPSIERQTWFSAIM